MHIPLQHPIHYQQAQNGRVHGIIISADRILKGVVLSQGRNKMPLIVPRSDIAASDAAALRLADHVTLDTLMPLYRTEKRIVGVAASKSAAAPVAMIPRARRIIQVTEPNIADRDVLITTSTKVQARDGKLGHARSLAFHPYTGQLIELRSAKRKVWRVETVRIDPRSIVHLNEYKLLIDMSVHDVVTIEDDGRHQLSDLRGA